eukprot:Blabericola_migrator_1__7252@NODE_3683_length_1580_cov_7_471249_g2285_i0_p1_GENE_NODE_3683_length_1580_cov_7_471249_g2285_i0NODE_3683_length_1580_cov_7_471249_g2285_i0_p1_ORF_typecomplete_len322_score69_56LptC/PF06835_13/0_16_NODE_3683_length_1580_cov_7_471249_g2285_i03631328
MHMSSKSRSRKFSESDFADEEARFYPPDGEGEDDGWEFDGMDYVQYDADDIPWVFDGEEMVMKDEDGNLYVQQGDEIYLKEGGELYKQTANGDWIPIDEEEEEEEEDERVQAKQPKTAIQLVPSKAAELTALALMNRQPVQLLTLSSLLGPRPGDPTLSASGHTAFMGTAPTASDYYRTFTSFTGTGPALSDTIRQIQYVASQLMAITRRGATTPADRLIYGIAATLLDLFDATKAEGDASVLRPTLTSLLKNNGGDLRDIEGPMKRRGVSLIQCRLDTVAAQIAMIAGQGCEPADGLLYRLCMSLRALIQTVSRSLSVVT